MHKILIRATALLLVSCLVLDAGAVSIFSGFPAPTSKRGGTVGQDLFTQEALAARSEESPHQPPWFTGRPTAGLFHLISAYPAAPAKLGPKLRKLLDDFPNPLLDAARGDGRLAQKAGPLVSRDVIGIYPIMGIKNRRAPLKPGSNKAVLQPEPAPPAAPTGRKIIMEEAVQEYLEDFGIRLRAIREGQGLTQADLLKKMGTKSRSSPFISRLESGEQTPRLSTCYRLAKALRITLAELLDTTKPPPVPRKKCPSQPIFNSLADKIQALGLTKRINPAREKQLFGRTRVLWNLCSDIRRDKDIYLGRFYGVLSGLGIEFDELFNLPDREVRRALVRKTHVAQIPPELRSIKAALEGRRDQPQDERIAKTFQGLETSAEPLLRRSAVLMRRYLGVGIPEGGASMEDLGQAYAISRERVSQLIGRATAILEDPTILDWLEQSKGFAGRVRERMDQLSKNGKELARESGIPEGVLGDIFSGEISNPRHKTIIALARALQTNVTWIILGPLFGTGNPGCLSVEQGSLRKRSLKRCRARGLTVHQLHVRSGVYQIDDSVKGKGLTMRSLLWLAWALKETPGCLAAGELSPPPAIPPATAPGDPLKNDKGSAVTIVAVLLAVLLPSLLLAATSSQASTGDWLTFLQAQYGSPWVPYIVALPTALALAIVALAYKPYWTFKTTFYAWLTRGIYTGTILFMAYPLIDWASHGVRVPLNSYLVAAIVFVALELFIVPGNWVLRYLTTGTTVPKWAIAIRGKYVRTSWRDKARCLLTEFPKWLIDVPLEDILFRVVLYELVAVHYGASFALVYQAAIDAFFHGSFILSAFGAFMLLGFLYQHFGLAVTIATHLAIDVWALTIGNYIHEVLLDKLNQWWPQRSSEVTPPRNKDKASAYFVSCLGSGELLRLIRKYPFQSIGSAVMAASLAASHTQPLVVFYSVLVMSTASIALKSFLRLLQSSPRSHVLFSRAA